MKNIVVGVTGSIAAYKTPLLLKMLVNLGYNVKVVMTRSAKQFVTSTTLSIISGHKVYSEIFDEESLMDHITLSRWADLILVVPTSANFIAKLANGLADDMLTNICIATTSPIILVPAMNNIMWANCFVRNNVRLLIENKISFFGPIAGTQICGESGIGNMMNIEDIVLNLQNFTPTC